MGVIDIFKRKQKPSKEMVFLGLVKSKYSACRMHNNSIRQYSDDHIEEEERYNQEELQSLERLKNEIFETKFIFHGACLNCVAPKKYGFLICTECKYANWDNGFKDLSLEINQ